MLVWQQQRSGERQKSYRARDRVNRFRRDAQTHHTRGSIHAHRPEMRERVIRGVLSVPDLDFADSGQASEQLDPHLLRSSGQ